MRLVRLRTRYAVACALMGCGGTSGAIQASDAGDDSAARELDCAWLAGTSNCFRAPVAAAAQSCAISGGAGTLSGDGTKCTFSSGAVVTFAMPLTASGTTPDFSVQTDGGAACLSGGFPGTGVFITTSAGTTSVAYDSSTETVTLTCPDGTTYAGSATVLNACMDELPGISIGSGGIGDGSAATPVSISIALAGNGTAQDTPLFGCNSP